jgi:alpha-L-rhamnosidase
MSDLEIRGSLPGWKSISIPLSLCLALLIGVCQMSATEGQETPPQGPAPSRLLCENQVNPLGVDSRNPRLTWLVTSTERGSKQMAYQILVSDGPESLALDNGKFWDSGRVKGEQSVDVIYQGQPLASRTTHYWKVRTWDTKGNPSAWSEVATWETGIFDPGEWKAQWIKALTGKPKADPFSWGDWIWMEGHIKENGSRIFLRKSFDNGADFKVISARIRLTADNEFDLYLNGELLGKGEHWEDLDEFDVTTEIREGKNVIAIEARNREGDCGVLLGFERVPEDGKTLTLRSDDSWKVTDQAVEGWQNPDLDDSSWKQAVVVAKNGEGAWGTQAANYKPSAPVLIRKSFNLAKEVKRARAYVSGLGGYEMSLNGQRVGTHILSPEWTDYSKRIQYQTYDITPLLQTGENTAGLFLGNAWWGGILMGKSAAVYKADAFLALCQIEVDYKDGSHDTVITDTSWKGHSSPILSDSLYHGENYDARLELHGWNKPGFNADEWASTEPAEPVTAQMVSQQCEPIQVTQELKPITVKEPTPGVFVFDMGQNMVGWARLKVSGPAGTTVQLRFAEVLKEDGTLYTENYRSAKVTDHYTLKGEGEEVWEPRFTYRGYRYVEVTGFPGTPTMDSVTGIVFHSNVRRIGEFECSNELINQIQKNITWGIRGNIESIPTDCPQRDERLGWTGDAQAIAPTASRNFDMNRFFDKWITDLVDTQNPSEGWVSDVAPSIGWGPASPAWGDALVIVPWVVYLEYGDTRILEDHYEAMAKWIGFMEKKSVKGLYKPEHIFGDWVAPIASPKEPIASAYFYYSTSLMARIAKVLGKDGDYNHFKALAMKTAAAFNHAYFNLGKAEYEGGTQTANLLPLHFGIVPEDLAPRVAQNIVNDIRARDFHLSTGFLGSVYLMPALSRWSNDPEVMWRLAVQDTYPSWGYMVRKDATTIWELWNSDTEGPAMNSRNHYALGAVGQWYYQTLAGIDSDPDAPGYKQIHFKPTPLGDLQWAKASIYTRYGVVSSSWRREGEAFLLDLVLPANTHGRLELPVPVGVKPVITESGITILSAEKPAKAKGVKYLTIQGDRAVFDLESGTYSFKVTK